MTTPETLTSFSSNSQAALHDYLSEKREKTRDILCDDFPPIQTFNEMVFTGSFSWTATKSKVRLVPKAGMLRWAGLVTTPPELARSYLDICYPSKLRASGAQVEAFSIPRNAPLYVKPGPLSDAVYIDIVSAYWQIMSIVGWDVDYHPGRFLSPGRAPHDFPLHQHKVSRNCLVSAGQPNPLTVWTGSRFEQRDAGGKHKNLGLIACINDVLMGCAAEALKCGATYINTDGYILPADRADILTHILGERWGLESRIKHHGPALVTGVGSYQIGGHRTKSFRVDLSAFDNIRPVENVVMLKDTVRQIARDRVDRPGLFRR